MEVEGSATLGKRKREFHSPHHRQNLLGQILRLGDRKPVRQELKLADSAETGQRSLITPHMQGERQSRPLEPEIEEVCKATRLDVASRAETVKSRTLDCKLPDVLAC